MIVSTWTPVPMLPYGILTGVLAARTASWREYPGVSAFAMFCEIV